MYIYIHDLYMYTWENMLVLVWTGCPATTLSSCEVVVYLFLFNKWYASTLQSVTICYKQIYIYIIHIHIIYIYMNISHSIELFCSAICAHVFYSNPFQGAIAFYNAISLISLVFSLWVSSRTKQRTSERTYPGMDKNARLPGCAQREASLRLQKMGAIHGYSL